MAGRNRSGGADDYINELARRVEALERRPAPSTVELYVQPDEPEWAAVGALWWDTDEPVPEDA